MVFLAGCSRGSSMGAPEPSGPITATFANPPSVMVADKLTVTINPKPPANTRVSVSLSMPSMSMPPNNVNLAPQPDGSYTGNCVFTMPGKWIVATEVNSGTSIQGQAISVNVK